jgi:hypothetical protein
MAQPSRSDVHTDLVLLNFAQKYMQSSANFVAGQVFPRIGVNKASNKYRIWTKNDWFRDEAKKRAPGTPAVRSGYNMSSDTYTCDFFAIAKDIADRIRKEADSDLNLDEGATRFVVSRLMLRREIQWVADFFATGKWATDAALVNQWSDYANSDPIADIEAGKEVVRLATGFEPNKAVFAAEVWSKLKNHPDIIDRLGIGGSARETRVVTREAVAAIFELDAVYVAKAVKATNQEGATAAYASVSGKHALLVYAPDVASLDEPTAGAVFGYDADGGAQDGVPGLNIRRKRDDLADADIIEGELAWDNKITGSDLGYFIPSAVA